MPLCAACGFDLIRNTEQGGHDEKDHDETIRDETIRDEAFHDEKAGGTPTLPSLETCLQALSSFNRLVFIPNSLTVDETSTLPASSYQTSHFSLHTYPSAVFQTAPTSSWLGKTSRSPCNRQDLHRTTCSSRFVLYRKAG